MSIDLAELKSRLKHGPRMSRQMRVEYLLTQVDGSPRRLSEGTLQKLKAELERIAQSTQPAVRRFVARMWWMYPETRP
jgi:hypothetical protein